MCSSCDVGVVGGYIVSCVTPPIVSVVTHRGRADQTTSQSTPARGAGETQDLQFTKNICQENNSFLSLFISIYFFSIEFKPQKRPQIHFSIGFIDIDVVRLKCSEAF